MNLKTVLGWLAVAFIIWWVISAPTSAAHLMSNLRLFLTTTAGGISHFFTSI